MRTDNFQFKNTFRYINEIKIDFQTESRETKLKEEEKKIKTTWKIHFMTM